MIGGDNLHEISPNSRVIKREALEMKASEAVNQLQQRRVMLAAVIYVSPLWAVLQGHNIAKPEVE